jgi:polysaccharide pyruvyl transferase WcaK-like protein
LADSVAQEREDAHMAFMRAFIEAWIGRTGLPVVICPEVRTEIETARDHVYAGLSPGAQAKCIPMGEFWTTEQAYSLYRRAEIVVSMEMHSIIMALSLGTPVLLPQFSENGRKAWMLEELGFSDWLFDIDGPSGGAILDAALQIHGDHGGASRRVRSQLPHLKQLGMQVITEIETGWRRPGFHPSPVKD